MTRVAGRLIEAISWLPPERRLHVRRLRRKDACPLVPRRLPKAGALQSASRCLQAELEMMAAVPDLVRLRASLPGYAQ